MTTLSDSCAVFTLNGRAVCVRTPDSVTAAWVRRLFPAYKSAAPRHDHASVHTLVEDQGQWVLTAPDGAASRFSLMHDALNAVEYAVTLALLGAVPGFLHLHASGASGPLGAVLALGRSGAGKSSLALSWSAAKLPVFGDDTVLIDDVGHVHAFKRMFGVQGSRLDDHGIVLPSELTALSDGGESYYDPDLRSGWASPQRVHALAVVQHMPGSKVRIESLSTADALAALVASAMPTGLSAGAGFDRLAKLAETAQAVRLTFEDSLQAARFLVSA